VVGAGLAGLAAARRLREHGAEVTVLERAERLGGRATHDEREGGWFDAGAQAVSSADRELLALVAECGLAAELLPLRPVALAQLQRGVTVAIDPGGGRGIAGLPGVRRIDALRLLRLERILARFGAILDPSFPEKGVRLDDRSLADFVRLYFGRSVLERWAGPFVACTCQAEEARASRLLFLLLLRLRRWATCATLRGGLGTLAEAAAAPLDVRLGASAEAIEPGADGGIRIRVESAGAAPEIEADAVVVAARAGAAGRIAAPLLAPAERDHLEAVRYTPAVVLHATLERPLLPMATRVRFPHVEGWPLEVAAIEPTLEGGQGREGGPAAVSLVATAAWSRDRIDVPQETLEKELVGVLDRLQPGASGWVRATQLRRHREAWPSFEVGSFRSLARLRRVLADRRAAGRRLYLAGDYLALPTLDGAVSSGRRAADDAAADLGLSAASPR